MDFLIGLFGAANSLSPLAIIGLLIGLLYVVLNQRQKVQEHFDTLRSNDLHELAEISAAIRRIEVMLAEQHAWLKARL